MKVRGKLVKLLVDIDPSRYKSLVVIEKGTEVLYLNILRAIYGMLEASLLWYRKLRSDLESIGFKFNTYDQCVTNRTISKKQHTLNFHVDDILSSHVNLKVNDEFGVWLNKTDGKLKPVSATPGKVHKFLGMTLDFSTKGERHVLQDMHIKDILKMFPEKLGAMVARTPASDDLFKRGPGKLLSAEDREVFHSIVAKCLYVSNRSRPDISPTVSILCGRVRDANKNDWEKLHRLLKYLSCTKKLHLIFCYDWLSLVIWHVDASFTVHDDFKSQSWGLCMLSEKGGDISSGSTKQRLTTRCSTKSEIVSVDDFHPKLIWTLCFLECQGHNLNMWLYQDNTSTIMLETKDRSSLGQRSRAISIHYFAITDSVKRGDVKIVHCLTDSMVGDFFTKPFQGSKFLNFKNLVLMAK